MPRTYQVVKVACAGSVARTLRAEKAQEAAGLPTYRSMFATPLCRRRVNKSSATCAKLHSGGNSRFMTSYGDDIGDNSGCINQEAIYSEAPPHTPTAIDKIIAIIITVVVV